MNEEPLYHNDVTICTLIANLFVAAVAEGYEGHIHMLRQIFIKAKKMDRKLYEYKYGGILPTLENNSWEEKDWEAHLDKLEKETLCRIKN